MSFAAAIALLAAVPAFTLPKGVFPEGAEIEAKLEADVTGDGRTDVVAIGVNEEKRTLVVYAASDRGPMRIGSLEMGTDALGLAELSVVRGVLLVKNLTGGTTAISSTYRYRYDPSARRMRLIGDDVMLYSRTFAHGMVEISTNRLTGLRITTRSELANGKRGDQAYIPGRPVRSQVSRAAVWMEDSPDPWETTGMGD